MTQRQSRGSSDKLVTEKNAEAEWIITEEDPTPNTGLLANLFLHSSATQDYLFPRLQARVWLTAICSDPYKTLHIQQILNIFLFTEMSTQSTTQSFKTLSRTDGNTGVSYLFVLIAFHSKIIFNHNVSVLPFPDVFRKLWELSFIQNSSWFQRGLKEDEYD